MVPHAAATRRLNRRSHRQLSGGGPDPHDRTLWRLTPDPPRSSPSGELTPVNERPLYCWRCGLGHYVTDVGGPALSGVRISPSQPMPLGNGCVLPSRTSAQKTARLGRRHMIAETSAARNRPRSPAMPAPVTITFLGGLGEIGRNCAAIEIDEPDHAARLRADVPRRRHAGHRPGAARLHLPARHARPHRGLHRHPRPRGPHGWAVVPAPRAVVPDHRLGPGARPGPQPHRGSRAARPHRVHRRSPTTNDAGSARSTASSSPSPTRCRTGSPPRSTRRRARSCTRATSSSTSTPSTVAAPTSPRWARSPRATASGCCCPTRPTRASTATHDRRHRSARCCTTCSTPTRAGASSPRASPATSTACNRSPTPRSPSTGSSPRSAGR